MADEEAKRKQQEKERKKAEVRARLEAASASKKKKGFMTPARKKKLRTLLRKKAAEELKREQERKAEERKKTIHERCGTAKNVEGVNEAGMQAICKEYYKRICSLEDAKYDLEYAVRQKDYVICREYYERVVKLEGVKYDIEYATRHKEFKIHELNMVVNDMRGKFIKPPLKKVSKFEYGKFEKLMRAAKKADNDFRANLKQVEKPKFKLDDDVKEAKPDWALGSKEGAKKAEE